MYRTIFCYSCIHMTIKVNKAEPSILKGKKMVTIHIRVSERRPGYDVLEVNLFPNLTLSPLSSVH